MPSGVLAWIFTLPSLVIFPHPQRGIRDPLVAPWMTGRDGQEVLPWHRGLRPQSPNPRMQEGADQVHCEEALLRRRRGQPYPLFLGDSAYHSVVVASLNVVHGALFLVLVLFGLLLCASRSDSDRWLLSPDLAHWTRLGRSTENFTLER